jgi:hypothetical protein
MWPFRQRLLLNGRGGTNYIIQATTLFWCGRQLDSGNQFHTFKLISFHRHREPNERNDVFQGGTPLSASESASERVLQE